jgi:hypothetical protein
MPAAKVLPGERLPPLVGLSPAAVVCDDLSESQLQHVHCLKRTKTADAARLRSTFNLSSEAEIEAECQAVLAREGLDETVFGLALVAYVKGFLVGVPRYDFDLDGLASKIAVRLRQSEAGGTGSLSSSSRAFMGALAEHTLASTREQQVAAADQIVMTGLLSHHSPSPSDQYADAPPSSLSSRTVSAINVCPRLWFLTPLQAGKLMLLPCPLQIPKSTWRKLFVSVESIETEGSGENAQVVAVRNCTLDRLTLARPLPLRGWDTGAALWLNTLSQR